METSNKKRNNQKSYDFRNGIFVFGEPRSGTTWLVEMLSLIQGSIINWEPLHPVRGVVPSFFNWGYRPYIPEDDTNDVHIKFMEDVLSLQVGNDWTRSLALNNELDSDSIVITKLVRGNMLIPWFLKKIECPRKPILIIRHPFDTCISQIKNFSIKFDKNYKVPDCLNNDRFLRHGEFIDSLPTQLERKIALWCLNNLPSLNYPDISNKISIVFYENLVLNPKGEMSRILRKLGVGDVPDDLDKFIDFKKPSSSDFMGTYIDEPSQQLEKNFKATDEFTRRKVQEIFDYFDFTMYTSESPYPQFTFS